jgi:hypothetical protein
MAMQNSFLAIRSLKWGLLALACSTFVAACEKEESPTTPSGAGSAAGTAGTAGGGQGGGTSGQGGLPAEVRKGERGSSCDSTTDCGDGLSCIVTNDCPVGVACANKSCQPSNFEIIGTGKQCHVVDCASQADCCGDMPVEMPEKCLNRDSICFQPTLPDCIATYCTEDADCGSGTCSGLCSQDAESCMLTADCAANTCDTGEEPDTCTVSGADCSSLACIANTCSTPICRCANPDYDPADPICSDEDCEGICGFTCEEERCVVDLGCEVDIDCPVTTPFCQEGQCVECKTSEDCEEEVECMAGRCGPECEVDTQCPLFQICQANECTYVGCQSDRECVLSAGNDDPTKDPRLAECNIENGVGTCVFPCDIDAQCAATEVCLEGVCEYIGCETNSECKTIVGLHDQPLASPERPWTTTAECRDEVAP